MALRVRSYETTTITIDGEPVTLKIKRMTQTEWTAWLLHFQMHGREPERRQAELTRTYRELVAAITPADVERRKAEMRRSVGSAEPTDAEARLSLDPSAMQVVAAFEVSLTAEQLEQRRARELEARHAADVFTAESIAASVSIEGESILDEDTNSYITSGAAFVAKFGARPDILSDVLQEIYLQHRLSDADKRRLSEQRAAQRPSPESATEPAGVAST